MGSRWTKEQDATLAEMWAKNFTDDEIEAAIGKPPTTFKPRAADLRLGRRYRPEGKPTADGRTYWTSDDDALLDQLRRRHMTLRDIAEALGRTKAAVESRLRKPGLQKPKSTSVQVRKLRECMRCKTVIMSDGYGHRLCNPCKVYAAYACGQYD
ncbi:hypothetical protein GGQ66_000900 [Rhizobium borbori]|uniref:Uncharacterized protein n=1 Tax=Allorhizobium borbori TaxID=485907 RepID=A0A7W6K1H2_9HYPH|nr:hypothetical protein [Allorhizobium borbori]